jgi:hypothetical protein
MKRILFISIVILVSFFGCSKDKTVPTSGTATINNTLNGTGPYYANGFSFASAGTVSTLEDPGPDIILYVNIDNLSSPRLTFQAENFMPSFYKLGDYPDAAAAIAAFNNLTTVGTYQWTDMADPVKNNQVWVYRSGDEKYSKIRIISIINEKRPEVPTLDAQYGECTFEWVHQPDGSTTFPAK